MSRARAVAALAIAGCGHIGFDSQRDAASDSLTDSSSDSKTGAPLVDRGVVARYFLDDGATGQTPAVVTDAIADPFDLSLMFDTGADPSWFADARGRGLTFPATTLDGGACAPIGGKFVSMISGATQATLEVVAFATACESLGSRLLQIGYDSDWRWTLACRANDRIGFAVNDLFGDGTDWAIDFSQPRVVTAVMDSTSVQASDRVRVYIDGVRQTAVGTNKLPAAGEFIDLQGNEHVCIGNRFIGARTIAGTIKYGAFYATALSDQEVAFNAARLLADDDR